MTQSNHTVSGVICVLGMLLFSLPVAAAPLHPRFFGDAGIRVPPETPPVDPGLQAAAANRFGRHWTAHPRLLVLLADFSDRPADTLAHPPAYFERLLFSRGEIETGSFREWYDEATYGKIDWTGHV